MMFKREKKEPAGGRRYKIRKALTVEQVNVSRELLRTGFQADKQERSRLPRNLFGGPASNRETAKVWVCPATSSLETTLDAIPAVRMIGCRGRIRGGCIGVAACARGEEER